MPGLGVYFALSDTQLQEVLGREDQDELHAIVDDLEDTWDEEWTQETDEAWDAMHRCLNSGAPLAWTVLGGEDLSGDPDFVANLVRPEKVKELAAALAPLTEAWFRERYQAALAQGYQPHADEDDFEYTWDWFLEVRELYQQAAQAGRAVLFTVEQDED